MFNKLRNKFLLINLVTISIMMIFAFTSIYVITYKNVSQEIDKELSKISEFNRKINGGPMDARPNLDNLQQQHDTDINQPPERRSVSFTLITDKENNIITKLSAFDAEDSFYVAAKDTVISQNTNKGKLKLDNSYWAFIKIPHLDGYRIVFLNITSQQGILKNLIYTFIIVASAMLFVIFFISRFFANKSIKPIKEAFDKQKLFIADASHELKTPLAVISTNVDVLLSNGEENINNQSKWLNYIKSEVERMTKLTNDLLYLTQLDYSDVRMIFSDLNLSETVENVILTMEAVIFENNINFEYDIEPDLMIHGNTEQIKQIVMILLDNAVKYSNNKGSISLSLKKAHSDVVLSVSNTGEGIQEDHLEKIFDRFYRTDKSRARKTGGYGLGLAIAKAITEQHGGRIYAKSVINERTTFTVEIPRINS